MKLPLLSERDHIALARAVKYWTDHWDQECPTLFGLRRDQLEDVINAWADGEVLEARVVALAASGAMRELLYGASSVTATQVKDILGVSYEEAVHLKNRALMFATEALKE